MNNEEKRAILKRLYDEGNITIDEMLTLSMNDTDELSNCQPEVKCAQITIDDVINIATSDMFHEEYGMNVDNILRYMDEHDWRWRGKHVTREMFVETMHNLISGVIKNAHDYIKRNNLTINDLRSQDKSWTQSTGGISVTAYFDDDDILSIEASFTIDNGCTSVKLKDLIDN